MATVIIMGVVFLMVGIGVVSLITIIVSSFDFGSGKYHHRTRCNHDRRAYNPGIKRTHLRHRNHLYSDKASKDRGFTEASNHTNEPNNDQDDYDDFFKEYDDFFEQQDDPFNVKK